MQPDVLSPWQVNPGDGGGTFLLRSQQNPSVCVALDPEGQDKILKYMWCSAEAGAARDRQKFGYVRYPVGSHGNFNNCQVRAPRVALTTVSIYGAQCQT